MTVDELLQPVLNTTAPLRLADGPETIPTWDSLAQINIILAIESLVGGELTTAETLSLKSVGSVVEICRAHGLELTVRQ